MDFTLRQSTVPADSVVDELRAEGISYEDIRTALDLQATQRQSGVPVLPLRVICGLEQHKSTSSNVLLNATRAIVGTPKGGGRLAGSTSRAAKYGRTASGPKAPRRPTSPSASGTIFASGSMSPAS